MDEFGWTPDLESGYSSNRVLSAKVREAAIASTLCMPFADPEPGYGPNRGSDTVTIHRIGSLAEPSDPRFEEHDRIPIDRLTTSTRIVTVQYFGRAVPYTHKAQLLAHYDVRDKIQKRLRQQMALSLDTACATALKDGQINFIPSSPVAGTFDTDGTPTNTAAANLSVTHVKLIRDYMKDTLHVPGYNGGNKYVCLASTKALRGIKDSPEFIAWNAPQNRDQAFTMPWAGEIEGIRFLEVDHVQAFSNSKGTGGVLGEATFLGDDAVAMAIAMDPELRAAIPGNFGLSMAIAWLGMLEFVNTWGDSSSDGEARTITVTSA